VVHLQFPARGGERDIDQSFDRKKEREKGGGRSRGGGKEEGVLFEIPVLRPMEKRKKKGEKNRITPIWLTIPRKERKRQQKKKGKGKERTGWVVEHSPEKEEEKENRLHSVRRKEKRANSREGGKRNCYAKFVPFSFS